MEPTLINWSPERVRWWFADLPFRCRLTCLGRSKRTLGAVKRAAGHRLVSYRVLYAWLHTARWDFLSTNFAPKIGIFRPLSVSKGVSLPSTDKERNIHDFGREFSLRGSFLAGLCILMVGRGSRAIRESPLRNWWDVGMLVADRGRFVNRPYGVAGRGTVGRGSRDVEGAVPYNGHLRKALDKSKFGNRSGYVVTFLW